MVHQAGRYSYLISIEGQLTEEWKVWFGDVSLINVHENNLTYIWCPDIDLSTLYGILTSLGNINAYLLGISRYSRKRKIYEETVPRQ